MMGAMLTASPDAIVFVPLDALSPWEGNPRTITSERKRALRDALRHDPGALIGRPLMATTEGTVYAGNMRLVAILEEKAAIGHTSKLVQQIEAWGGVPCFVDEVDEPTMLERAVRDNQGYGAWERDLLAGLVVGYEETLGGDAKLMGVDAKEADTLRSLVTAARAEETPEVPAATPPPEVEPRRRPEAFAVTVTFESKDARDAFAAGLRDQGHERVHAHVGRWSDGE
jgi:hypothetical protein